MRQAEAVGKRRRFFPGSSIDALVRRDVAQCQVGHRRLTEVGIATANRESQIRTNRWLCRLSISNVGR
jgi:hypothetical protein